MVHDRHSVVDNNNKVSIINVNYIYVFESKCISLMIKMYVLKLKEVFKHESRTSQSVT